MASEAIGGNKHMLSFVCRVNHLKKAFTGQRSMGTQVIEVTEFNYEVSLDLRGHLEATMTSEATKMAVRGNMHMNIRVFEVADFNFILKN